MWLNWAPPSPAKAKQGTAALLRDGPQDSASQLAGGGGLDACSPAITKTEGEMQPQATSSNQAWDILDIAFRVKQMCVCLPQPLRWPPRTSRLGLKCRKPSSFSGGSINCGSCFISLLKPLHSVLLTSCYSGVNVCRQNKKNKSLFCHSQYRHVSWDLCRCPRGLGTHVALARRENTEFVVDPKLRIQSNFRSLPECCGNISSFRCSST